jgi:hypothetical protein
MSAVLAIYDALLEAGIPEAPARRIVEAFERDMTTVLATKVDLFAVKEDVASVRQEIGSVRQEIVGLRGQFALLDNKIEAAEGRMLLRMENLESRLESRLFVKLGGLMAGLFSVSGTLFAIFR